MATVILSRASFRRRFLATALHSLAVLNSRQSFADLISPVGTFGIRTQDTHVRRAAPRSC